jgi:hypothetical protein
VVDDLLFLVFKEKIVTTLLPMEAEDIVVSNSPRSILMQIPPNRVTF